MPVKLEEIARRAGVSVITVSRALTNHPDVSPKTRARVSAIAAEMDYIPNAHARALAGGSSRTLGLIVADNANPNYAHLIRGVEETARKAGYGVVLCNTNENADDELAAHHMLRQTRVDGILITSVQSGSAPLRRLEQEGIPFVLLSRYVRDLETDCVLNDNYTGARTATGVLCDLGHRRILHLTGPAEITSVHDRLAGYRQALADRGLVFRPDLIVHG
ncbi:MAG TPA: LacI family DNA-binding transcriptional regulator, partial [Anaerolineae bacterium]